MSNESDPPDPPDNTFGKGVRLENLSCSNSEGDGLRIEHPDGPVTINNITITGCKGSAFKFIGNYDPEKDDPFTPEERQASKDMHLAQTVCLDVGAPIDFPPSYLAAILRARPHVHEAERPKWLVEVFLYSGHWRGLIDGAQMEAKLVAMVASRIGREFMDRFGADGAEPRSEVRCE